MKQKRLYQLSIPFTVEQLNNNQPVTIIVIYTANTLRSPLIMEYQRVLLLASTQNREREVC